MVFYKREESAVYLSLYVDGQILQILSSTQRAVSLILHSDI